MMVLYLLKIYSIYSVDIIIILDIVWFMFNLTGIEREDIIFMELLDQVKLHLLNNLLYLLLRNIIYNSILNILQTGIKRTKISGLTIITNNYLLYLMIMIVVKLCLIISKFGLIGILQIRMLKLKVTVCNKIGYLLLLHLIIIYLKYVLLMILQILIQYRL